MPDFETPRTLAEGDTGEDVVMLQQFLIALGFDSGTADGNFSSTTAAEVINFKARHGLSEDAVVDPDTWAAFFADIGPVPNQSLSIELTDFPALAQAFGFGTNQDIDGYLSALAAEA
jgi:peptidoglycan hydrolase-like protein with peptidoglycan-binding domain